ncbi:MAG: hypothetical protein EXR81_02980 [Gammaproteobacteria bacterium]|nr:hypothetical protein [Gammaproteobacteria bacterium]
MNLEGLKTLNEIKAFLDGTHVAVFEVVDDKQARYAFIKRALNRFTYGRLKKGERGIMVAFLQRVTGYSRQQITRLIAQHQQTGQVIVRQKTVAPFVQKYNYCDMMTPFDRLKSLPDFINFLKPDVSLQQLEAQANALSDDQAAKVLREHRAILFNTLSERLPTLAA